MELLRETAELLRETAELWDQGFFGIYRDQQGTLIHLKKVMAQSFKTGDVGEQTADLKKQGPNF